MSSYAVGVLGFGPVAADVPVLHADDVGLTRGDGCFEATRVVTGADGSHRIDHLEAHFDRFDRSCAGLELPPLDRPAWRRLVELLLAGWHAEGEAMLRLMLTRGREPRPDPSGQSSRTPVTGIATLTATAAETLRQRREGVDVITLRRGTVGDAFTAAPWLLGGVKTLSYAINVAALREAKRRGAQDAIFVDAGGAVLEAPTATVVWQADGVLHTVPSAGTGILASITQQALFRAAAAAGTGTATAPATVADLLASEGCWLVSSGRGVAQVNTLDGVPLKVQADSTARLNELAGF